MLGKCLQKIAVMSVPDPDSVIPGARNQMISVRFKVLNTTDLMLMSLERLVAFEFLLLINFPKFNGHVTGATSQIVSGVIIVQVIHHASVLSQSLLAFSCLVVPDFN